MMMQLNIAHQLQLLHDLLDDHVNDLDYTLSEYEQIKRLVRSIISQEQLSNEQLSQFLPEIYHYGSQGKHVQNIKEHIITNQQQIENWLEAIMLSLSEHGHDIIR